MVLNVGAIYVLIMITISLFPAVKSVFKSFNPLVIAASIWVIVRLINMLFAAVPQTNFSWFLFWLCIGILNSKEMLQMISQILDCLPAVYIVQDKNPEVCDATYHSLQLIMCELDQIRFVA